MDTQITATARTQRIQPAGRPVLDLSKGSASRPVGLVSDGSTANASLLGDWTSSNVNVATVSLHGDSQRLVIRNEHDHCVVRRSERECDLNRAIVDDH